MHVSHVHPEEDKLLCLLALAKSVTEAWFSSRFFLENSTVALLLLFGN